jgi:hypothetical protein
LDLSSCRELSTLTKACSALENTVTSVESLHRLYNQIDDSSSDSAETPEKQDLLRAMLLFSASGLDATIKRLIKDALYEVAEANQGSFEQLRSYIGKKIIKSDSQGKYQEAVLIDTDILTSLLLTDDPKKKVIDVLGDDLLQTSFQSADQVLRAAAYFAIETEKITDDVSKMRNIFKVRNKITHESDFVDSEDDGDIDRVSRDENEMIEMTNDLLKITYNLISGVRDNLEPAE